MHLVLICSPNARHTVITFWLLLCSFSPGWDTESHLLSVNVWCIALLSGNVFTHSLLPSVCSFLSYLSVLWLEWDAFLTLHAGKEASVFLTKPPVSVTKHWRACVKSCAWRGFWFSLCVAKTSRGTVVRPKVDVFFPQQGCGTDIRNVSQRCLERRVAFCLFAL